MGSLDTPSDPSRTIVTGSLARTGAGLGKSGSAEGTGMRLPDVPTTGRGDTRPVATFAR